MEKDKEKNPATKKRGLPKCCTNNPHVRMKGSKNKISYDIHKIIWEKVPDVNYINAMFDEFDGVEENDKRTKLNHFKDDFFDHSINIFINFEFLT